MPEPKTPRGPNSDARFLGWQETPSGAIVPFFVITAEGHPLYHSTVSETTLRNLGLRVPELHSPNGETGPSPWHNVGIALNRPGTAREAIEIAGLDYTVAKKFQGSETGLRSDAWVTIRTDTGEILGSTANSDEPIQNRDAFAFFDAMVKSRLAVYETAGIIGRGERIWIQVRLPGYITVHGNDVVKKYLLLTNSHDGGISLQVKLAPIRVVCNNTLTCAFQGFREGEFLRHPDSEIDTDFAIAMLGKSHLLFERVGVIFNRMAARKITERELRDYLRALVPDREGTEDNAEAERLRDDMLQLHDAGRGAYLARGTLWGAFNSVTEYTDHMMLDGDATARLNSIWFGRGEQFKLKAFHLAERMMPA